MICPANYDQGSTSPDVEIPTTPAVDSINYGFAETTTMSAPPNQTLRLVQWGVKNFLLEMSTEESLGAIPITLLFDCFCVDHLFSNQKLRASLISPVLVSPVFDERCFNSSRSKC